MNFHPSQILDQDSALSSVTTTAVDSSPREDGDAIAIGGFFSRRGRGNFNATMESTMTLTSALDTEDPEADAEEELVAPGLHSKFNKSGLEFLKSSFLRHVHEILEQGIPDGWLMDTSLPPYFARLLTQTILRPKHHPDSICG